MLKIEMLDELRSLQNNGDIESLKKHRKEIEKKLKSEYSEENVLMFANVLLYLIRLHKVRKENGKAKIYGKELVSFVEKEIANFPNNGTLYGIISNVYGTLGDVVASFMIPTKIKYGKKSVYYYKKLCEIDPYNEQKILWDGGHCLNAPSFVGGDIQKGMTILEDYIIKNPEDEYARYMLGNAYVSTNADRTKQIIDDILSKNKESFFAEVLKEQIES